MYGVWNYMDVKPGRLSWREMKMKVGSLRNVVLLKDDENLTDRKIIKLKEFLVGSQ